MKSEIPILQPINNAPANQSLAVGAREAACFDGGMGRGHKISTNLDEVTIARTRARAREMPTFHFQNENSVQNDNDSDGIGLVG